MKSLIAAVAATSALLLSACTAPNVGGNQEDPAVDFWGNMIKTSEPLACSVGEATPLPPPVPGSVFDPAGHVKPLDTPPGHNWVVLGLQVVALSQDFQNPQNPFYCVPVHVHYEKRTAEVDLFINGQGPVVTEDFYTTTAWQGYVSFDYDPGLERFQARPPMYEVTLTATYIRAADTFNAEAPAALGCHIRLFGASVAGDMVVPMASGGVCTTNLVNNFFNLA